MEGRLSGESLKRKFDSGVHHLAKHESPGESLELAVLDLESLLTRSDLESFVPQLPPQQIYFALKTQGLEENHELLNYISTEQLVRLLDYDCWNQTELSRPKAFQWLKYFHEFGPTALYERYSRLDEEYQISLLQGLVRVYDEEEIEKLPWDVRDRLIPLPGQQLFYDLLTEDQEEQQFIVNLIESSLSGKVEYAFSLLQHATYDVPNEPSYMLSQFRQARLEEDGFVTADEARSHFLPINIEVIKKKWQKDMSAADTESTWLAQAQFADVDFLSKVRQAATETWTLETALSFHQQLVVLANNICTACHIEPNQIHELKEVFAQSQAIISLGLEFLSDGQVNKGVEILTHEHTKIIFRVGLTLVFLVRRKLIEQMKEQGFEFAAKLETQHNLAAYGQIQWFLDTECFQTLGFERTEKLKGLFNRFPMRAVSSEDKSRYIFKPIETLAELNKTAEELSSSLSAIKFH